MDTDNLIMDNLQTAANQKHQNWRCGLSTRLGKYNPNTVEWQDEEKKKKTFINL